MRLEFDPAKDAINRAKHGLSLSEAADLDFLNAVVIEDDRRQYGKRRFRAWGYLHGRMHMLAFTLRNDVIRVISLRRASKAEERRHGRQ